MTKNLDKKLREILYKLVPINLKGNPYTEEVVDGILKEIKQALLAELPERKNVVCKQTWFPNDYRDSGYNAYRDKIEEMLK